MKVWDRAGIELATPGSAVRHVTDCAAQPGWNIRGNVCLFIYLFYQFSKLRQLGFRFLYSILKLSDSYRSWQAPQNLRDSPGALPNEFKVPQTVIFDQETDK